MAQAAEITVYSPQIVNGPLQKLADAWAAETGNKVTFAGFNVGRVRAAVTSDVTPADVMVAPTQGFADYAAKQVPGMKIGMASGLVQTPTGSTQLYAAAGGVLVQLVARGHASE